MVPERLREGVSLRGELGVGGRVWLVCGWARPPLVFSLPVLSKRCHLCSFFYLLKIRSKLEVIRSLGGGAIEVA